MLYHESDTKILAVLQSTCVAEDGIEIQERLDYTPAKVIAEYLNSWKNGGGYGKLTATVSENTVVVAGCVKKADKMIALSIDENVLVIWEAHVEFAYCGPVLFYLEGDGVFRLSAGGRISSGTSNYMGDIISTGHDGSLTIDIEGGELEHTGSEGYVFDLSGPKTLNITSGTIKSTSGGIRTGLWTTSKNPVNISGGTITCRRRAISHSSVFGHVLISGGMIISAGNDAISCDWGSVILMGDRATIQGGDQSGMNAVSVLSSYNGAVAVHWDGTTGKCLGGSKQHLVFKPDTATVMWELQATGAGISCSTDNYTDFIEVRGIAVTKLSQTTPVITNGGNISVSYGEKGFLLTPAGGESTGAYCFASSNEDVATVSENGFVTLGTGARAIGSTNIAVKKLGDIRYHDSSYSEPTVLHVRTASQPEPPAFTMTYQYNLAANNFTVFMPKVIGAEYSFDGDVYNQQRTTTAEPGAEVKGFMRYPYSKTHYASTETVAGVTLPIVPVTALTVSSMSGVCRIAIKDGTLQMKADLQPTNAEDKTVVWTVAGTGATISRTGLLVAKSNGIVTVRATAAGGSTVYGEKTIVISGQSDEKLDHSASDCSSAASPTTIWVTAPNTAGKPSQSSKRFGVKAGDWVKLGNAPYIHDTVDGNDIQVSLTIHQPERLKNQALLSAYIKGDAVDRVRSFFEKWYCNKIQVIHFDQQADWEQPVSVAVNLDLTSFDANNLEFYAYDAQNNSHRWIAGANCRMDRSGYLWFETPYAGDIIISEGTFENR